MCQKTGKKPESSLESPNQEELFGNEPPPPGRPKKKPALRLQATVYLDRGQVALVWLPLMGEKPVLKAWVECVDSEVAWTLWRGRSREEFFTEGHKTSIRYQLREWAALHHVDDRQFQAVEVWAARPGMNQSRVLPPLSEKESPWDWLVEQIHSMSRDLRRGWLDAGFPSLAKERQAEELARHRYNQVIEARQREEREQRNLERHARELRENQAAAAAAARAPATTPPLPPVPVNIEMQEVEFQDTVIPLSSLDRFNLRERASVWWVSNQSDDLLCLPHCRIERLEYQVRSALRVLGPLRGRALLSDEVGLGKTIEAGLVLKELLTRGMVKRYLVLTVPSLVDQWEEELNDKFGLNPVTTNAAAARDSDAFWRENPGVVASLHTLKQPAHLEVARQVNWDLLIVDEAHHLRNSASRAWQAVSALPRQFLLLLTATPVQNSLEELYNLVTLLQPGQLPPPREFKKRFIDPKRPRQPREPEELRRLLGQVMIRNTRANAGLKLPPRRAETGVFEPGAGEREFWKKWELEFRQHLARLNASQASLWGRLLLQAAGSSPAAWRAALARFPDQEAARAWREESPLEESWRRKCDLLLPLSRVEGGVVVFTQFLETQSALSERLTRAGAQTFVINGSTPAPARQPITEEFHKMGGILLLTHSGTEGRNLQFCHRLVNFDLPWNPMEIEQRIGRLHRYGQQHPVRIYNFTQSGTLQQHLLEILQEKLNLFELVVGETGLVLGDRFDGDDFAEEVLRRWRESDGKVGEAMSTFGDELAAARQSYEEVKELDQSLFADDYASDL